MDFQKLKEQLEDTRPETFLTAVLAQEPDEESEVTFSETIDRQFVENCRYLASDETISEEEVTEWRDDDFLVVAQTLDGDYISGTLDATMIIPSSLYREDIESYPLAICDFFIAYNQEELTSTILPKEL